MLSLQSRPRAASKFLLTDGARTTFGYHAKPQKQNNNIFQCYLPRILISRAVLFISLPPYCRYWSICLSVSKPNLLELFYKSST